MPLRFPALRFHPTCYYRPHDGAALQTWPALIAAVTDLSGNITGVPTRAAPWASFSEMLSGSGQ